VVTSKKSATGHLRSRLAWRWSCHGWRGVDQGRSRLGSPLSGTGRGRAVECIGRRRATVRQGALVCALFLAALRAPL